MKHESRVAIITGGSSGIGQAAAVALARHGFTIVVVGQNEARLTETLELVARAGDHDPGNHSALALDVASETDMQRMAAETFDRHDRIDLFIHSAGIGKKAGSARVMPHSTATLPLEEWNAVVGVNVTGAFLGARAVLPAMIGQGSGHILNVGSSTTPHGLRGTPFAPAYCATKFALAGLTQSMAAEVEKHGVRVQCLFPGAIETRLTDSNLLARPFGGCIGADSFAETIVYLVTRPLDSVIVDPHVIPFSALSARPGRTG